MLTPIFIVLLLALMFHTLRQYCAHRYLGSDQNRPFDGLFYQIGQTSIALSSPDGPATQTIICFPGFLETTRYFEALYNDRDCELILVNNAMYHSPFQPNDVIDLDWEANPYKVGTIAHDGFYLAQAIKQLATSDSIVLHGHSRGGAVVLDAGRQFPELMQSSARKICALLEAPVLPQAAVAGGTIGPIKGAIVLYLLPLVFTLLRILPTRLMDKQPMMQPETALKTEIVKTTFYNEKNFGICVTNARNIAEWQDQQGYTLFANFLDIAVLMGERDNVLDNTSMLASARAGQRLNSRLQLVPTTQSNHFISLETPAVIHEVIASFGLEG